MAHPQERWVPGVVAAAAAPLALKHPRSQRDPQPGEQRRLAGVRPLRQLKAEVAQAVATPA
jgi:hypothetical protein